MAAVAIALARGGESGWAGHELTLEPADDLEAVGEQIAELVDGQAPNVVLLVEEDDEWFALVRWVDIEGPADPRVFLSDRRVLETSELAARLFGDELPLVADDDPDEDSGRPELEPAGDPELLADLGTGGDRLVQLTIGEGLLPADALAAVAEAAGAADAWEAARG